MNSTQQKDNIEKINNWLTLVTDVGGKHIRAKIATDDSFFLVVDSVDKQQPSAHRYLVGKLQNDGRPPYITRLRFAQFSIGLTPMSIMEARRPNPIPLPESSVGKLAVVGGNFDGGTLYDARLVAVFKETPENLDSLYQQLNEGKVILTDLLEKQDEK